MSLALAEPEFIDRAEVDAQGTGPATSPAAKGTYGQILKSSAIVGGSSLINICVGMLRTKLMALFLGPSGFGMLSVYFSMITLGQTVAGMGVNSSGVRQIAEAASSGNELRIQQTSSTLRRLSILLGLAGALVLVLFGRQISEFTFGTASHATQVRELSVAVFFMVVSAGQGALINGLRRIGDLARMSIAGPLLGTLFGVPLVYAFRDRGVVPSLIVVAVMTCFGSWWYSRKVRLQRRPLDTSVWVAESASLLKLGFAFMTSGLITVGVAYVVRILVSRKVGMEATGLYQSAWTLGSLYVGFILQAMGADFYPRLTACAHDDPNCNRLVNEQAHVGLLLGGPGVLATLTFAPLIIALFYSARFGLAVNVLRWICLGTLLQVVTWPMGFIIVAKARQVLFVSCEVAWSFVSLLLAWACVARFGLVGAGIAFFGSYVFHGLLIYVVVRKVSGFHWSPENLRAAILFTLAITIVFTSFYMLPFAAAEGIGIVASIAATLYAFRRLSELVPTGLTPRPLRNLLQRLKAQPISQQASE